MLGAFLQVLLPVLVLGGCEAPSKDCEGSEPNESDYRIVSLLQAHHKLQGGHELPARRPASSASFPPWRAMLPQGRPKLGDGPINDAAKEGHSFGSQQPREAGDNHSTSSSCGYVAKVGFMTLVQNEESGSLAIDLTDALKAGSTQFMATAMNTAGTYLDDTGFTSVFAYPMEAYTSTVFEFNITDDGQYVDIYKPEMEKRTSDDQSDLAVKVGVGDGWIDRLPIARGPLCVTSDLALQAESPSLYAEDRILINADYLVYEGWYVSGNLGAYATSYRYLTAEAYPDNYEVTVEYLMSYTDPQSPWQVGFSVVSLPQQAMTPRTSDDRLLFFTSDYEDLGFRQDGADDELPSQEVDRDTTVIWRYNLERIGGTIKIYVDPSVPERWRPYFKAGIEAWNDGFVLAGWPGAVRAVTPEDHDWPADYNLADVRYSTITWVISDEIVSMGIAKVDPRSGEIIKSDIMMSDGWVQYWLSSLDHLAPNLTHRLERAQTGRWGGHHSPALDHLTPNLTHRLAKGQTRRWGHYHIRPADAAPKKQQQEHMHARHTSNAMLAFPRVEQAQSRRAHGSASLALLSVGAKKPLSDSEQEELLGYGVKDVVMHEVGHILGLRHNFKGSMGVSYDCTQNMSCSAVQGLTASVMDYIPMNMPSATGPPVHAFTPVIGAYDKLAIRYGYTQVDDVPWPQKAPELVAILEEAESYGTCYDNDVYNEDPTCMAYDFTAEPLRYFEETLNLYAEAQSLLLNMSVAPGASTLYYGSSATSVISKAQSVGALLTPWLGGVNDTYTHRKTDGSFPSELSRKRVSAEDQKKALELLLHLARPEDWGLVPPNSSLPYFTTGDPLYGIIYSVDLSDTVKSLQEWVVESLLDYDRVNQIHMQEHLLADPGGKLGVGEFLELAITGLVGSGFENQSGEEWTLQLQTVKSLKELYANSALPQDIASYVLFWLRHISDEVEAAYTRAAAGTVATGWQWCGGAGSVCTCHGLVQFGSGDTWSAAIPVTSEIDCSPSFFQFSEATITSECQCLSDQPSGSDLLYSHLAYLRQELYDIFCDGTDPTCGGTRLLQQSVGSAASASAALALAVAMGVDAALRA